MLDPDCDVDGVDELEGEAFGSDDEVFSAGAQLSSGMDAEADDRAGGEEGSGGSVVSDMRYWKPWQPPLSTVIRRARFGFSSLVMISRRRLIAFVSLSWGMVLDAGAGSLPLRLWV